MTTQEKPQFKVGYRGESDYTWKGKTYSVRSFACPGTGSTPTSADGYYNGNYYFTGILPTVGTIRNESGNYHEFPPAELVQFFPGYILAKWNEDFTALVYDGAKPEVCQTKWKDVCSMAHALEMVNEYSAEPATYGLE